jgi:mannose-1-phosphate guanylyltransferase
MENTQTNFQDHLFVLIICGGGGTRLWPRSRKKAPKQFINLFGEKTLFEQTMERARSLVPDERLFVVTNMDYVDEIIAQGKISLKNIFAEPQGRNTALAMAAGAAIIDKIDSQAVIVNMWSDHLISPLEEFKANALLAAKVAFGGDFLVTVGLKPTFPHTGLGYIHAGESLSELADEKVFKVKEFKEKPDLKTAEEFVKSGDYYWNTGMFTWSSQVFYRSCQKNAPQLAEAFEKIRSGWDQDQERKIIEEVYAQAEDISIDFALAEKADNLVLVPASFSWSDVGSWQVIYDVSQKDENENVILQLGKKGEVYNIESKRNLIQFSERLIALVGVENLVVIDTPDALLVCQKDKAQEVKKVVEMLKQNNKEDYL